MDRYMTAQKRAIEIAKWERGEEINADPGNGFVIDWIEKFSAEFRDRWPYSKCKDCCKPCAYLCRAFCDDFEKE